MLKFEFTITKNVKDTLARLEKVVKNYQIDEQGVAKVKIRTSEGTITVFLAPFLLKEKLGLGLRIWGKTSNRKHIEYLEAFLEEKAIVRRIKPSINDFATEIVKVYEEGEIKELRDIIDKVCKRLGLSIEEARNYMNYIRDIGKRERVPESIKKAYKIIARESL